MAAHKKERGSRISRRDAPIIEKLMVLFGSAPSSKFQYEGPARHHLRSQFCLHGSPWATADARAGAIVAEALRLIGAERPTWQEAQPDYATPAERWDYCRNCGALAAMGANGRLRKYCSDKCSTVYHASNGQRFGFKQTRADYLAAAAAKRESRSQEQRDCDRCGKMFTPTWRFAAYCSKQCANAMRSAASRVHTDRACAVCGDLFRPRVAGSKYCSRICEAAGKRQRPAIAACAKCGGAFKPAYVGHKFCCRGCYLAARWGEPAGRFICEAAE